MISLVRTAQRDELERAKALLEGCLEGAVEPPGALTRVKIVKGRFVKALSELLFFAGLSRAHAVKRGVRLGLVCLGAVLVAALARSSLLLAVIPIAAFIEYVALQRRVFARAESFERDYTAMLLSLASSIRTGLDPVMALGELHKLFSKSSEIAKQLWGYKLRIDSGAGETAAIQEFALDIRHPDLPLFRTAFVLARREGSSLGHCLERLARVTRQRQSFRRKTRAAIAMQKLSAFGIGGCCVAIAAVQFCSNPEAFLKALHDPLGQKIMFGGLSLLGLGIVWMLRIAKMRI